MAGRKVASYESAREYESMFLSREDRAMLENILYGQPKSADCECQVYDGTPTQVSGDVQSNASCKKKKNVISIAFYQE